MLALASVKRHIHIYFDCFWFPEISKVSPVLSVEIQLHIFFCPTLPFRVGPWSKPFGRNPLPPVVPAPAVPAAAAAAGMPRLPLWGVPTRVRGALPPR